LADGVVTHKILSLLGLLLRGPKSGYDLHRIQQAHGELFADLKKGNVYYLLDRLAREGYLDVQIEPGTRGRRGERLIYSLTDQGRTYFDQLLRDVLRTPEPLYSAVGGAVIFLQQLPPSEAIFLLEERRRATEERRAQIVERHEAHPGQPLVELADDHLLSLIDADLAWTNRALDLLRANESQPMVGEASVR
jgi:DNA-binding PadR family transcriptional regulator